MFNLRTFIFLFFSSNFVFSNVIIDSDFDLIHSNRIEKFSANQKQNKINVNAINEEYPNLTNELINEIKSYQPIVEQITSAVVNGKYSGETWNA